MAKQVSPSKFVFLGGVPRSGTTWAQILIAGHEQVATSRETHALGRYVNSMLRIYDEQLAGSPDGMHLLADREHFIKEYIGPFLKSTMKAIAAQTPNAKVVLEKTPRNIVHFDVVNEVYGPRARMLHIIRDPRSVGASWQSAAKEDWGSWADAPQAQIAIRWQNTMKMDAQYAEKFGSRYRSVRYEDLLANPAENLRDILDWIGLDHDDAMISQMVENASLDKLRASDNSALPATDPKHEERSNFFRQGASDSWKTELTEKQIRNLEKRAHEGMEKHGYALSLWGKKTTSE
jgi:hypothetical protein